MNDTDQKLRTSSKHLTEVERLNRRQAAREEMNPQHYKRQFAKSDGSEDNFELFLKPEVTTGTFLK